MKDLKNKVQTICGIISGICVGLIPILTNFIWHPTWLLATLGAISGVALLIMGVFSGRNADGSKKTVNQLVGQQKAKDGVDNL